VKGVMLIYALLYFTVSYENLLSDHNTCLRVINVFYLYFYVQLILVKLGIGDPHTKLLSNLFTKMLAVKSYFAVNI
jgi:hypothetical protein